jgi:hypothetical protein
MTHGNESEICGSGSQTFLVRDKEEIGLYIVQETDATEFTIYLTTAESKEVVSIKKTRHNWDILTHGIPTWINKNEQTCSLCCNMDTYMTC